MIEHDTGRPPTPGLIAEALGQMVTLFENEIRLVRSEIGEKITKAVGAMAVLAVAAVLMLTALIMLLTGVVQVLIANGWQPYSAYFLVGIVLAALGGISVVMAVKALTPANLAPSRTMHQLGKDAKVVKEQVK